MDDEPDVDEVLDERPDLRPAVAAALAAEAAADGSGWTFEDIDADSGSFGELVSRGVVEQVEDGYRLVDEAAVRKHLHGEANTAETGTASGMKWPVDVPAVDTRVVVAVIGVLGLVVAFRLVSIGAVFRDGHVALSGNDPWYYRYWVEQIVTPGGFDANLLGNLRPEIANGEPLLVATLGVVAALFGGPGSVGSVLAWYPVVAALLVGLMVYVLATKATGDRRVGLAAVALLAIIPAHAMRSSLGYADHHAFDYLWLVITALSLYTLTTRRTTRSSRSIALGITGLGVGVAGQVLAWEAGPLLILPVGAVATVGAALAASTDRSPLEWSWPLFAGLGLAAALSWVAHVALEWHTVVVTGAPGLLLLGTLAVVIGAELTWRRGYAARQVLAVEGVAILGGILGVWHFFPTVLARAGRGFGRITQTGSAIAEVQPLISNATLGGIFLLGFIHVIALPALVWATTELRRGETQWLTLATYGWYFLALSLFQVRFLGELAAFVAIFGGVAFVWLASAVDLTDRPFAVDGGWIPRVPTVRTAGAVFALFVLVGGFGALQVPVKTSQLTIDDGTYETAEFLGSYAAQDGVTPDSNRYVFSAWSRNRVYNYFTTGNSRTYSYAQQHYRAFANGTDESGWYQKLRDRVGFVVTKAGYESDPESHGYRLHEHLGSATATHRGLGHFRAIFVSEGRTHAAFVLVPGARVEGSASPNATVRLSTEVTIPGGQFTYTRMGRAREDGGFYTFLVAYPGTYTVELPTGYETVEVPESAVLTGEKVRVDGG